MAIVVIFTPDGMTTEQYDEAVGRLDSAGAGLPPGRMFHVCYGASGNLRVMEVWESQEEFDTFGEALMPILNDIDIGPAQPEVVEAHNILE